MDKIIQFSLMVVLIACAPQKEKPETLPNEVIPLTDDQQYLYKEFKNEYFVLCLSHGYGPEDREFLRNDYSFAHDFPLGVYGRNVIDSLALIQLNEIRYDSLYLVNEMSLRDSEALGKKRVIQFCLKGYESQTLDSMALIWARKITNRNY